MRQTATYVVIALLMFVTIGHEAAYAGSFEAEGWAWLGLVYALAADMAVAVCAFYTRWATTRRWAWIGFFAFVAASGVLNVAHIEPWAHGLGAWVYALFPTGAQAVLGFLARDAGRLIKRRESDERVAQLRTQLKALRAEAARLSEKRAYTDATRSEFLELCANGNENGADLDAREANRILVRAGHWPVPDGTARNWVEKAGEPT